MQAKILRWLTPVLFVSILGFALVGCGGGSNGASGGADGGTLDSTFDSDGIVVHDNAAGGSASDIGRSITTDSLNRILVTGYSRNGFNNDMVIWRYNPDGTLDSTFDSDGIVVHDNAAGGSGLDQGYSITTDSANRILVTGRSHNGFNYDLAIWRYNSDGTLDNTFDSDGIAVHDSAAGGGDYDIGLSIITDSAGEILVTGRSHNSLSNDMVIWRYNPDGTLDSTFDSDGIVVHDSAAGGSGSDAGMSITTDSAGRMLVTGYSSNGLNNDMVIWRYNPDGTLDSNFDSDGIVIFDNAAGDDQGFSISMESSGKILVTGYSSNGFDDDMVIWRIIP